MERVVVHFVVGCREYTTLILICGSDKRSEKQVLSPDSDISSETERALLLENLQQTDTDSDDNSFDIRK